MKFKAPCSKTYWQIAQNWSVRDITPTFIAFAACLGVVIACVPPKGNTLDYPITVISAARVAQGELPYVDFVALYGPLQHVILGFIIGLFDKAPPALVSNIFFTIPIVLFSIVLMRRVRSIRKTQPLLWIAIILYWLLLTGILGYCAFYSGWPILMCLCSFFLNEGAWNQSSTKILRVLCATTLAVLTAALVFWRFNFGVYVLFATCLCIIWHLASAAGDRQSIAMVAGFYIASWFSISIAMISLPVGRCFLLDIVEYLPRFKTRTWNLFQLLQAQPHEWPVLLMFLSCGLLLIFLVWNGVLGRLSVGWPYLAGLMVSFLHYLFVRPDYFHAYPLICFIPLICHELVARNRSVASETINPPAKWELSVSLVAIASTLILYSALSWNFIYSQRGFWRRALTGTQLKYVDHFVGTNEFKRETLRAIRRDLRVEGDIFWMSKPGESESPLDLGTDISLYLLDQRLPKMRVWFFDPPITSFSSNQLMMVEDLVRLGIRYVVVQSTLEANKSDMIKHSNPPEPSIIYDFVVNNYSLVTRFESKEHGEAYDLYSKK